MFRHIPAASWTPLSSNNFPSSSSSTTLAQPTISNEFSSSSFLASESSSSTMTIGSSFLLSPLPPPTPFDSSSSSSFSSSSTFRSFVVPPVPSSFLLSGDRSTDAAAAANRDFHLDGEVHRSLQHSSMSSFLDEGKMDTIHRSKQDGVYGAVSFGDESPFGFDADDAQTKKAPAFGYHQNLEMSVSSSTDTDSANTGGSLLVPECPDYFDKYSSFYSLLPNAALILEELKDVFVHISLPDDQVIDFDFGKTSATMKCQTFVHCAPVQFRVSVFKNTYFPTHPQQAKFIVEFQKREGCCIAFRHVYKLLREKMSSQLRCGDVATPLGNVIPPCVTSQMAELSVSEKKSQTAAPQAQFSSSSLSSASSPPSSYDSFSLTPRPKLDKDSARLLCEMASSDCIQSSREALRALCHASVVDRNAAAQAVTASAEQFQNYFQMLSNILTECGNSTYSQDQELVRCCLQFITNLIEPSSSAADQSVEDIRSALFSSVSQLAGAQLVKLCIEYVNAFPHVFEDLLKMREIKRQSARFLFALAEVRVDELKGILQTDDINVLELHANCEDAKLQQYIHTILAKVR